MHDFGFLSYIISLLAAAVLIVPLSRRLNLSPVLGYMVAGWAVGPHALGIVTELEAITQVAELGIVFLLFVIGLELSLRRLFAMRGQVFGFGSAQVLVTGLLIWFFAHQTGLLSNEAAFIVGMGFALSSTAVVMEVLHHNRTEGTQVGRLSFAVLLLQDLAFVPLLVMLPLLKGDSGNLIEALGSSLIQSLVVMFLIYICGRIVIRPLYRSVGNPQNTELFAALTILLVLASAFATSSAGLSLALGAFIAGLLIAETEYQHQVMADVMPFKGLLIGLFFMSVGMMVDPVLIKENIGVISAIAIGLVLLKTLVIVLLCRIFGFPFAASIQAGLLLAQGSEFAFVFFKLGGDYGILDVEISQILLVVVTLTMALTPLLSSAGKKLDYLISSKKKIDANEETKAKEGTSDLSHHVIIAGYGRVGQTIQRLLEAEHIPHSCLDLDSSKVEQSKKMGRPVYYGDISRLEMLNAMGAERASAIIVTYDDLRASTKAVGVIKKHYPHIKIIARARDKAYAERVSAAGADIVIPETFEASLQLGGALLREVGTPDNEVLRIIEKFRSQKYALAREIL